jgi:pimeloyl-ACP methyl ester carboxylesterase
MIERRSGALLRAFLIQGLAGGRPFYFSGGLDVLARKLAGEGVRTSVHPQGSFLRPYGEVGAIADAALAAARKGPRPILIGHSMGADAALKVAVRLDAAGVAVPLVVCFDPTSFRLLFGAPPVPGNVARALCFYQKISPLGRGLLRAAPAFKGMLVQQQVQAIHSNVDDDPALHARVIAEVRALAQGAA